MREGFPEGVRIQPRVAGLAGVNYGKNIPERKNITLESLLPGGSFLNHEEQLGRGWEGAGLGCPNLIRYVREFCSYLRAMG